MAKTKQQFMKAVLTTKRSDSAQNLSGDMETTSGIKFVDKKTERVVIDARFYMGRARSATAVHCALWVTVKQDNKPQAWEWAETSGRGKAAGGGYHKSSAALASAITDAGIELYGSPYAHPVNGDSVAETKKKLKTRAYIGGCGDSSMMAALMAIAYASGWKDCVIVQY